MSRRIQVIAVMTAIVVSATAVRAQGTNPKNSPTLPPGTSDDVRPVPTPNADPGGVVMPPSGVVKPGNPDPGINVPVAPQGRMPVIPPPGTPGGNPNVQPK